MPLFNKSRKESQKGSQKDSQKDAQEEAQREAQKAAWLARRRLFTQIAKENQNVIIPPLIESDSRVEESLTSASLYDHTEPLSPLPPTEGEPLKTSVHVVNLDSFDCAESLTREGKQDIVVLNMASSTTPGGGYLSGAGAQEEALCRRSTLYITIRRQRNFHPIPRHGAIYSPDVLVFRASDDKQCSLLPEADRWWTSVVSVAAINRPRLTRFEDDYAKEEDREDMKERIKTMLRVAALEGRKNLVLGAFGCGAFMNPPNIVAGLFKAVLEEAEFKGRFEGICFAVIERGGSGNFSVFKEVLDGLEV
jgi:uncharacterized protein (TIGR02452 family)